jgi:putative transposase
MDPREMPHARRLRGGRWSEPFACYSIVKTVERRRKILTEPAIAAAVMSALDFERSRDRLKLLAYCLMPDHLHLLLVLLPPCNLSLTLANLFRYTATQLSG